MSDEIQQSRYDQIIRRVAGIIGPGSKVSQVITELFPMINVEDPPAELLRLGGTRLCWGGGQLAAVIGQAPTVQLFNPVDSGTLITVTTVYVAPSAAAIALWGINQSVRGALLGGEFRDTRDLQPSRTIGQVRQETSVTLASGANRIRIRLNNIFTLTDLNAVCVLAPGTGFEIGTETVNIAFNFSFLWRERPALESELNL